MECIDHIGAVCRLLLRRFRRSNPMCACAVAAVTDITIVDHHCVIRVDNSFTQGKTILPGNKLNAFLFHYLSFSIDI